MKYISLIQHDIYSTCRLNNFLYYNNRYSIRIQMSHLTFVPSQIDKNKLYREIEMQYLKEDSPEKSAVKQDQPQSPQRKLSEREVKEMLARLTKDTKKEYDIQQQITHILSANIELKKRRNEADKVQNRLLEQGKKIEQKKQQMAKELAKQTQEKYYRQIPEISNKGKNIKQKTIDKRLDKLIADRMNKRDQLKDKYQPKFAPIIDPHSEFINDLENYGDWQNRMQIKEEQACKRKEFLMKKIIEKQKEEYTFKPVLNEKSKDIAENMTRRPLSSCTPLHKQQLQEEQLQSQIYPFAPTINKNTEELIKKKTSGHDSNCFRRLYNQAKEMTHKQQQKVKEQEKIHKFQPTLNDRSLKIASSIPRKASSRLSINGDSDEQYQVVKLGPGNDSTISRVKAYSLRNSTETGKDSRLNISKNYVNGFQMYGKLKFSNLR